MMIPYLTGRAVDSIALGGNDAGPLAKVVLVLLAAYGIDAGVRFLQNFLMAGISQRIVLLLRQEIFAKLQSLPLAFFDRHTHGEVMSRVANDLDNVSSTIAQSTIQLMSSVLVISGSFVMMVMLSPALTAASLITVPLVFSVGKMVTKRTRTLFRTQQAALGQLNGYGRNGVWDAGG